MHTKNLPGNLEEDERIMLKWILEDYNVKMWIDSTDSGYSSTVEF